MSARQDLRFDSFLSGSIFRRPEPVRTLGSAQPSPRLKMELQTQESSVAFAAKKEPQEDASERLKRIPKDLQTPKTGKEKPKEAPSTAKASTTSHVLSDQVRQISKAVRELESKEQRGREKRKALEEENKTLVQEIVRLNDQIDKERVDHQAKFKALEVAYDAAAKELEEERNKSAALKLENEDLAAHLATVKNENEALAKSLEEKAWESYIYRCATNAAWRSIPSLQEQGTYVQLVWNAIKILKEKKVKEMEAQANNNKDAPTPKPEPEEKPQDSPRESSVHSSDTDSESEPLASSKRKRMGDLKRRFWYKERDDSDDEKPLVAVLEQKAKRLKAMSFPPSSQEDNLSDDEI